MTDKDFEVSGNYTTGDDTSCNQVGEVEIQDDKEDILKYQVHSASDNSFEIFLMFKRRVDDIQLPTDTYSIKLVAKVL